MTFAVQYKAILAKNFKQNFRQKEYIRELISALILLALIAVLYKNDASNQSAFIIPFYMTLAITSYSRAMVLSWVTEKQTRQKELQKIMGMSSWAYTSAWFTYFLLNGLYVSVIFIVPLLMLGVFDAVSEPSWKIIVLYLLFMLSTFTFVLFISSFFRDSKTAAQACMFIQLICSCLYFLISIDAYRTSKFWPVFSSILPPIAYDFVYLSSSGTVRDFDYSFSTGLSMLVADSFLYLILFLYFDQVIHNQYGTHKHPLFFLQAIADLFKSQNSSSETQRLIPMSQDVSSARYHESIQINKPVTVQMMSVTKNFGNLKAVDKLSLKLYQQEIFCLLGHNGAGKSTTINLLTGLLTKDSGLIQINGLNDETDIDRIRKITGLCLQQDVLYDNLTIQQHLKFYALVKGMAPEFIQNQIQHIISKCALRNQVGKFAKNLSGGNKRKLSLANALVAGSRVVFLDQPSSGLDPNSRQAIWDILKQVRNDNRTIVLTTHHLEEAEHLAQRIGIMAKGKLLILGSCDYIKQNFGVGYHLLLTFTESTLQKKDEAIKIVESSMPGVRRDDQSATNVLKFILPLNRQDQFQGLFRNLQPLGIDISLKMCSLEDTFVNIGMNEDQLESDQPHEIPSLPQIDAPSNIHPEYAFSRQFSAVFLKKAVSTLRSFSSVVSIVLPVIFILIGTIVTIISFKGQGSVYNYVKMFTLSYFMVWGFIFNTSAYCGNIVLEREKRFKYLSNVMGLRKFPYWVANFTFDIIMFLVPVAVFFIVVLAIGGQNAEFLTSKLDSITIIFVAFAFSFIPYSYAFSFVFQKSSTAFRFFPFMNFLFFFALPSIPNFLPKSPPVLVKYIMPSFSPFLAFFDSFQTETIIGPFSKTLYPTAPFYQLIIMMFLQGVAYFSLTLFLQSARFSLKDRYHIEEQDLMRSAQEDEDVVAEIQKVALLQHPTPIVVDSLYKKYSNGYVAIRNNTFTVEPGQMFGLLGPNGAGKSTTFNILTAAIPKTSGFVKLQGQEINKGMMDIFGNVGICPQFDSLYDNLTVREHLLYFARLKGQRDTETLITYYLQVMQLTDYEKTYAGKLSGGNKRKLCVSMALIGNPELMFFDEPSSGVDPIARRFLWRTLNESLKETKSSIVLTTHSMNEAESLCNRIGILIKGKFVCLGTPASLKKKYGDGYRITASFKSLASKETVLQEVKKMFPRVLEFVDQENKKVSYQIRSEDFRFCQSFSLFGELQKKNHIENFEINEASLQQIFLFFSRMQPVEEAGAVRPEPWQLCCFELGTEGCIWNV